MHTRNPFAFTLIELLVVISIMSVLAGITIPVVSKINAHSRQVSEISAARHLITAFHLYSADNDGKLLAGYKETEGVDDAEGNALQFPASARYPWRLAPYLDYNLHGSVLVNERAKAFPNLSNTYGISATPSLGMNVTFVGGDFGGSSDLAPSSRAFDRFGKFCVTRSHEPVAPQNLIVFASARSQLSETPENISEGYFYIKSPYFQSKRWNDTFTDSSLPSRYGHIHPRHNDKAVAAMFDGHVALLDETALQDMRNWSNLAAIADDPKWTLKRTR